jgi:ring-1,2-phenylacetyl-CoA epoxidase subunit PaaD
VPARSSGEAGPGGGAPGRAVRCPFCGSDRTRLESPFGSTLGFALYWCERCRTAFEYLKWEDEPSR